jgi:hypothetical protein
MLITLQILLGLVTLICFLGGMNLMLKGTKAYLPADAQPIPVLDNLFRFLSGIYFGLGFLMAYVLYDLPQITTLIYFIGIVVLFSGFGRLYSLIKVGRAGTYYESMMAVEIALGLLIIIMEHFR